MLPVTLVLAAPVSPAARLRAIAAASDAEADRIAAAPIRVGIMGDLHHAPSREEMMAIGKKRTDALVLHYRGRARLYRRCAEAAEAVDALDPDALAVLA